MNLKSHRKYLRYRQPILYRGGIFFNSSPKKVIREMIQRDGLKAAQLFCTHDHWGGIHDAVRFVEWVTRQFEKRYGKKHGRVVAELQYNGREERGNVVMLGFFLDKQLVDGKRQ